MTDEYLKWFEEHINKPYFTREEKDDLLIYCWMAWRDSSRVKLQTSENKA